MNTVDGMVVPWVAMWTDEYVYQQSLALVAVRNPNDPTIARLVVQFEDEIESDRIKEFGDVLWNRVRLGRTGRPVFGQVNSRRQIASMIRRRCQVCGKRIDGTIPWLMSTAQLAAMTRDEYVSTNNPPTCVECISVARRLCPHLQGNGSVVIPVGPNDYQTTGVRGDLFTPDGKSFKNVALNWGDPNLSLLVAKQLLVSFDPTPRMTA